MNPSPGVSPGTSILLTGGAGFIGSHLAARLVGAGARVTVLDDLNDAYATHLKQENLRLVSEQGSFDFLRMDIAIPWGAAIGPVRKILRRRHPPGGTNWRSIFLDPTPVV